MHRRSLLDLPLEVARNETSDQEEGDASNSVGNYVDGLTVVYRGLSSWFHKLGRGKSDQECSCSTLSEHIGTLAAGVRPICKQQIKKRGRSAELELAGEIYAANVKERNELMPDLESVKRSNPQMAAALERKLLEEQVMSFYGTPLYPCLGEERLGSWGEGGKWLCRPFDLNEHSVVYSVGSFGESSFEKDVYDLTGAVSHTFDPTLDAGGAAAMQSLPYLRFHNQGFTGAGQIGERQLGGGLSGPNILRAEAVMANLGHSFVDVLKIDCEGCELGVFADVLEQQRRRRQAAAQGGTPPAPLFGQVQVELHCLNDPNMVVEFLRVMEELGYLLFHVEQNWLCWTCVELAYIHRSLVLP